MAMPVSASNSISAISNLSHQGRFGESRENKPARGAGQGSVRRRDSSERRHEHTRLMIELLEGLHLLASEKRTVVSVTADNVCQRSRQEFTGSPGDKGASLDSCCVGPVQEKFVGDLMSCSSDATGINWANPPLVGAATARGRSPG